MSAWQVTKIETTGRPPIILYHRGTAADKGVLHQIFGQRDYAVDRLRRGGEILAIYDSILSSGRIPFILDAGANIGASVVYFGLVSKNRIS